MFGEGGSEAAESELASDLVVTGDQVFVVLGMCICFRQRSLDQIQHERVICRELGHASTTR
jgi:hypothetical protein